MAVLYTKIGGQIIDVGGPGTPQPIPGAATNLPNTFTADQTFTGKLIPRGSGALSVRVGDVTAANVAASAIAVGDGTVASSASTIAIGTSATASGTLSVAIGPSAVASGANRCVALGRFATASGTSATALGGDTQALAANCITVGYQSLVEGGCTGGIAIGQGAQVITGTFVSPQLAIGFGATSKEGRAVALGPQARAWGISSTAVGRGAIAVGAHAIAIGRGSWTNADNMICIGDGSNDVYFGSGHTHKYLDQIDNVTLTRVPSSETTTLHAADAFDATDGLATSVAGGHLALAAGRGTGTAPGGTVSLQVAPAGGVSNNTKNTLVKVVEAGVSGTARTLGFYGATPVAKQTGVAVTAAGVHAALVNLGLIAA